MRNAARESRSACYRDFPDFRGFVKALIDRYLTVSDHLLCFGSPLKCPGERYDFVLNADQPVGAYWIQLRGLGECGIRRAQQLAILRYARGPYQPASPAPTYDVGIPQGIVSSTGGMVERERKRGRGRERV